MIDTFNKATLGGDGSNDMLDKLTGSLDSLGLKVGGAKKRRRVARTQKRTPKRSGTPKRRPTKKRQRKTIKPRRPRRPRRSRNGGIFNTLPALALLAASETAKRRTNSSIYANQRRYK